MLIAHAIGSSGASSREFAMKLIRASKPASAVGVAAVACALFLGSGREIAAQQIPWMTVKIFNNETKYNLYPVYSTGISQPKADNWLQAWFKVPRSQWDTRKFVKANQFRFYVNPEGTTENPAGGIPPGGSVVISV